MGESILEKEVEIIADKFREKSFDKEIYVVGHFDTDGISSVSIMIQALRKLDLTFSVKILKNLDEKFVESLPKDKLILFLDLGSNYLNKLSELNLQDVFVLDHHEIVGDVPEKIFIVNPELCVKEKISASGITYLFCKHLDQSNREFAKLAVLGMIGDRLETEIDKLNHGILEDGEIKRKKGLLIYPSTRPLNRTLEFSSNPFIEGVTGNTSGVLELLRESGLKPDAGKYPCIIDLNQDEMQNLVTSIVLRQPQINEQEILGDIFLVKFFNKLEDARELSAIINACSRFGESGLAIEFCLECVGSKKNAESVYAKYKQGLIAGLKFASNTEKIVGDGYAIINGKDQIKDVMVGTIASIFSNSNNYKKGTVIVVLAFRENEIKVSARIVGRAGRNLREMLYNVVEVVGGEIGGHECAAGCVISLEKEKEFIKLLKKNLEIEMVRV